MSSRTRARQWMGSATELSRSARLNSRPWENDGAGGTITNPPPGMINVRRKATVMRNVETLLDAMYRFTFDKEQNAGWKSNELMRKTLMSAKRFVADEKMSRFMADLSNVAFIKRSEIVPSNDGRPGFYKDVLKKNSIPIVESMRVQSRLPHEAIWIEYYVRDYQTRSAELRDVKAPDPDEMPYKEGWLIFRHPLMSTANMVHIFSMNSADDPESSDGFNFWTYPLAWGWCTDESALPWERTRLGEWNKDVLPTIGTGISGYKNENVGIVQSPLLKDFVLGEKGRTAEYANYLIKEWTGHLRRIWSLLSTIDSLPMAISETRVAKSFMARGYIRKGLEHKKITLNIPAKLEPRILARRLVAAVHRKRHGVRGHWRDHHWHMPAKTCDPHLWECVGDDADTIECTVCKGRQIYIHEHERGDEKLGRVVHNYELRHP